MSVVSIRDGKIGDCADLAILDNIAGHGFSYWFWQGAVKMGKASDAYDWGRQRLMNGVGEFGWKNARIAEQSDAVLGASISYLLKDASIKEIEKEPAPIRPVMELFAQANGCWLLDALAVYSASRGKGIGRQLMTDVMARGRESDCKEAALVAEDSNSAALALYQGFGFSECSRLPYVPFNISSDTKNWLLLKAPL